MGARSQKALHYLFASPQGDASFRFSPYTSRCEVCGDHELSSQAVTIATVPMTHGSEELQVCRAHQVACSRLASFYDLEEENALAVLEVH